MFKSLQIFLLIFFLSSANISKANDHKEAKPEEGAHGEGDGEGEKKPETKEDRIKKAKKENQSLSDEAIEELRVEQNLDSLSNPNYIVFESSVYQWEQRGEGGVNYLIQHLKRNDDDKKIIRNVIYTIGRLGPKAARAVPILIPYLSHKDGEIRGTAVAALGKIGKPAEKAIPQIKAVLYDENKWAKDQAIVALERIGTKEASKSIIEFKKLQAAKERDRAKEELKHKLDEQAAKSEKKTEEK
jgi:hypothetical protein